MAQVMERVGGAGFRCYASAVWRARAGERQIRGGLVVRGAVEDTVQPEGKADCQDGRGPRRVGGRCEKPARATRGRNMRCGDEAVRKEEKCWPMGGTWD